MKVMKMAHVLTRFKLHKRTNSPPQLINRNLLNEPHIYIHTYHIITDGAKRICATHIHSSVIHFVQGSNVVAAFHLQQDPAERMPRSELC